MRSEALRHDKHAAGDRDQAHQPVGDARAEESVERVRRPQRGVEENDAGARERIGVDAVALGAQALGPTDRAEAGEDAHRHAQRRRDEPALDAVAHEQDAGEREHDATEHGGAAHADPALPVDPRPTLAAGGRQRRARSASARRRWRAGRGWGRGRRRDRHVDDIRSTNGTRCARRDSRRRARRHRRDRGHRRRHCRSGCDVVDGRRAIPAARHWSRDDGRRRLRDPRAAPSRKSERRSAPARSTDRNECATRAARPGAHRGATSARAGGGTANRAAPTVPPGTRGRAEPAERSGSSWEGGSDPTLRVSRPSGG